jgi:hypothetical protein
MRQQSDTYRLLESDEFVRSGKRALCRAFLLILALIAAAMLAVLLPPPSRRLGPELDLLQQQLMPVVLAAGERERDAPEPGFATGGPECSQAYAPPIPQEVQTVRGSKAGTGVASSKRVHIHQGVVMAKLASHRKRAHAVLAHVGERHRRAAMAVGRHVPSLTAAPADPAGLTSFSIEARAR